MSPRAACRLATLGYDAYDYAAGKVDWLAHGLPTEGTAASRPIALALTRDDVATCAISEPGEEIARRIDATSYGFALALSPTRVVLGRVRRADITAGAADIAGLIEPGPSTIRPHTPIKDLSDRLARSSAQTVIVTDPEGRLIGVVRRRDVEGAV